MANKDDFFMRQALKLAAKAVGKTFPNPLVGAVVVLGGKVIGSGYHKKAGMPHAEVQAFNSAKLPLKGSTLYVNLEPCCHFGRTPPCVDAIIKAKIGRVVFATLDPNPKVSGQGAARLRKAGVMVSVGLRAEEARKLNEAFFVFHKKSRPFITLKFAASLDGKIATRTFDSRWITNQKAREFARGLRSRHQAVLVGINTVLYDNPHLGSRAKNKRDPLRIILDERLRAPLNSKVFRDSNVLLVTTAKASLSKRQVFAAKGIALAVSPGNKIFLPWLMQELFKRQIISLLVEGGGQVLGSFVDAGLADKVYSFHAPLIIGGEKAVSAVAGHGFKLVKNSLQLNNVAFRRFGDNILISGYPKSSVHKSG